MNTMYPDQYRYTQEHEWVHVDGDKATVGITHYAQEQLGDVVYVELPRIGAVIHAKQSFGTVESVKAVSDLYAPMSGKVTEVNESLVDAPEILNEDPHTKGWLVRARISDKNELDDLMTAENYQTYVAAEAES
jgi:glycine cleavage system H protein